MKLLIISQKLILILALFTFTFFASERVTAQDADIERLVEQRVDSIIAEGQYTRIPNEDFETIIDNKVSVKINEKLRFWVTIIGLFITALGGLGAYTFNNKIQQIIKEQADKQVKSKFESINEDLLDYAKFAAKSKLEDLKKKYDIDPNSELNVIEGKKLLSELDTHEHIELLPETIDLVGLMNYTRRKAPEIDKLIENYGERFELKETTYMNAAILHMDDYELNGSKYSKQQCVDYCNFVSKRIPHYGEPKGTLILLYAIDHQNAIVPEEKEDILKTVRVLIQDILKGSSGQLASSTVSRINRDKKSTIFGHYISHIETQLPEEFSALYEKAMQYEQRNGQLA
ncbi:hypothetical protein ACFQ1M_09425 [Sungkyunkwania multivorans]|uniref:Uncharacterized protein n=1 Tax=Sungkyunkwania multivorans TaxID=1173618 RepID=A0ABW3CZA9_9FLAO